GLGMPPMEAMACGAALVTYDNGGCRDYARDGHTALVARRRDVADLAAQLEQVAPDPALRARLAAAGSEFVLSALEWRPAVQRLARTHTGRQVRAGERARLPGSPGRARLRPHAAPSAPDPATDPVELSAVARCRPLSRRGMRLGRGARCRARAGLAGFRYRDGRRGGGDGPAVQRRGLHRRYP